MGYVASCCGVPDTEPQLHSALLADRLTSSVHSGLLPVNFGSYLDRITLPAPLFPSSLLASALMPSSLTATFPGVSFCSNTGERDSEWPTSFEHWALSRSAGHSADEVSLGRMLVPVHPAVASEEVASSGPSVPAAQAGNVGRAVLAPQKEQWVKD